jgi:hypothetical protein
LVLEQKSTARELLPGKDNGMNFELDLNGTVANLTITHQLPDGKTVPCTLGYVSQNISPDVRLSDSSLALEAMQTVFPANDDTSGFLSQ